MALKLMYITNRPEIGQIAEMAGVDRIFVDLENIGKAERQCGMSTVLSNHTIDDVKIMDCAIEKAELLVRCNPIHKPTENRPGSREEINTIISNGADIIMLPYFKRLEELQTFINIVDGRVKIIPLVETSEAVAIIDDILNLGGFDEIFIGLNDLSISYRKKFMFELLSDGTVEELCYKFRRKRIPYGFGGIASIGKGMLPSEKIIKEHYRLGSTSTILSRSFCNVNTISHMGIISSTFVNGIREIREYEKEIEKHVNYFRENIIEVDTTVKIICENLDKEKNII